MGGGGVSCGPASITIYKKSTATELQAVAVCLQLQILLIPMAALLSTCEVSTAVSRGKQPQALAVTPQQKENIERTWKMVEGQESGLLDAGIILFKKWSLNIFCAFFNQHFYLHCRLFTIAPGAQQMFKSFKDTPFEELPENEDFRSHALQVTETISLAISAMEDMESLADVLKDLGGGHSTHGLQDAHFDVRGLPFAAQIWICKCATLSSSSVTH